MPNMSYCRFENTSNDLQDCLDAIDETLNEHPDESEFASEDEYRAAMAMTGAERLKAQLSSSEFRALLSMMEQVETFKHLIEQAGGPEAFDNLR